MNPKYKGSDKTGIFVWDDTNKTFVALSGSATGALSVDDIWGFIGAEYDYVSVAYPNTTTETYTFKTGGAGGTTVSTVTIVYTDATKADLSTVTKS
jgi:hypothetical protein